MLSPREKQVVDLLLLGKSNKQIALALGVSERTIEFHLKNIYIKMQVGSRVELILKLVESTVVFENEKIDNGNQPARMRAAQAWKSLVFLIKKEVAMTLKISIEDLENYLKHHTVLFSLLALAITSLVLQYIFFDLGLYFWGSYLLLEVLLLLASVRFSELLNSKKQIRPLMMLSIAGIFPFIAAGFDQLYINTILRFTSGVSEVALNGLFICSSAEWLTSPDGTSYLSTTLSWTSEAVWVLAFFGMLGMFFLTRIFGKRPSNLVTA
jgi:DNA-binding CsgD family transcriptional regulator